MRSYGQYCVLARALDLIGDRWTLLIVRELFARDGRYSDLRDGLPGIATNMLAERLRTLTAHGLVEVYDAPRPVSAPVYRLTERGRSLGPVLQSLVQWGASLPQRPRGDDHFRMHWLTVGLPQLFAGCDLEDLGSFTVLVRTPEGDAAIRVENGTLGMRTAEAADNPADDPADVEVVGDPDAVFAILTGTTPPPGAEIAIRGSAPARRRLRDLAGRSRVAGQDRATRG